MRKILLLIEHFLSTLDAVGEWLGLRLAEPVNRYQRRRFAVWVQERGEIGPDDDGAWCSGYPTGDRAPVFVSPPLGSLDRLEELASRSLGPSDPRLLGRTSSHVIVDRKEITHA